MQGDMKQYLSGDEAFAEGVRLAAPEVISAYPITPQTIVVERLSEMIEEGTLDGEFIHVESEHSALSCAMGASAMGVRTFTATSSQGLLYMAECLPYAAGGRYPIVMMNANRSTALPWSIYGDQRDSISQLDSGWIQMYPENAQESLDMALQSYYLAEHPDVMVPVMVNLDGFVLTHTYEAVEVPQNEQAEKYLPKYETTNRFSLANPQTMAGAAGPAHNLKFHVSHHEAMVGMERVLREADEKFEQIFHRSHGGLVEEYRTKDAECVLITVGSISGLAKEVVDELRAQGKKAGVLRLRFLRPFPERQIREILQKTQAVGVLEKDLSFGYQGTIYTNVKAALQGAGSPIKCDNFIGGIGGKNIAKKDIYHCFEVMNQQTDEKVHFMQDGEWGE